MCQEERSCFSGTLSLRHVCTVFVNVSGMACLLPCCLGTEIGAPVTVAEADSRAPAFKKYSREFMRTLAFSEHEAFDHPVACKFS